MAPASGVGLGFGAVVKILDSPVVVVGTSAVARLKRPWWVEACKEIIPTTFKERVDLLNLLRYRDERAVWFTRLRFVPILFLKFHLSYELSMQGRPEMCSTNHYALRGTW